MHLCLPSKCKNFRDLLLLSNSLLSMLRSNRPYRPQTFRPNTHRNPSCPSRHEALRVGHRGYWGTWIGGMVRAGSLLPTPGRTRDGDGMARIGVASFGDTFEGIWTGGLA